MSRLRPRLRTRPALLIGLTALAAAFGGCGSRAVELDKGDQGNADVRKGAELFSQRCGGCHTLTAAGTEGSSVSIADQERVDGPNFNVRKEDYEQVLYAIRNGGYSGAIMPQNLVTGQEAEDVARFLSRYAGRQAKSPKTPTPQNQPVGGPRPEVSGQPDQPQQEQPVPGVPGAP